MVLVPVILDCMRPSKARLPFGWTRVLAGEGQDKLRPSRIVSPHDRSPPDEGMAIPSSDLFPDDSFTKNQIDL